MAKKQTRRTISFNRGVYAALKRAAKQQDKSIAHFVEDALRAAGLDLPATTHVKLADAQRATRQRHLRQKEPSPKQHTGPIRQTLGDDVADWAGEA